MKKVFYSSLLTSALLAGVSQTSDGTFIDLYADRDNQSNIIATVSTAKGDLIKQRCFNTRSSKRWCKVKYVYKDLTLHGYTDEASLLSTYSVKNRKPTFDVTYGGRYDEVGNDIIALDDGFLIVGSTSSFGNGQKDAYVVKVDKFGNKLYSLALGGSSNDEANAVVALKDSFMLAGYTGSYGNGVESLFVANIAYDGSVLWQKGYYSDDDDYYRANDIVKISENNTLVAGFENRVKFFASETNIYVNAINSQGERNGVKRYGGSKVDEANSIIKTDDGYIIAGMTKSWGSGGEDAYVIKIDKEGNRVWHNVFGYRFDEVFNQIIATDDGGYIAVGTTDSDIRNQQDVYVVKINAKGEEQWSGHYGSREDEEGFGIVQSSDGYVIAGYTKDTKSYNSDAYLLKLNRDGKVVWSRKYGLEKDDEAKAIIKTDNGYIVTGYKTSLETYSKDLYILKVDSKGYIN
jgi:hypothetical protein